MRDAVSPDLTHKHSSLIIIKQKNGGGLIRHQLNSPLRYSSDNGAIFWFHVPPPSPFRKHNCLTLWNASPDCDWLMTGCIMDSQNHTALMHRRQIIPRYFDHFPFTVFPNSCETLAFQERLQLLQIVVHQSGCYWLLCHFYCFNFILHWPDVNCPESLEQNGL